MVGGENIKSDTKPEPKAKVMSSSSSPFSVCCLEGPDDFSSPFPPYPVASVHSTSPEYALSENVDMDDIDNDGYDDVGIRASVIRDVKRL